MFKARYKYTLLDRLRKLPYEDYEIAMKWFPEVLRVHPVTFKRWIYIKSSAEHEIPGIHMVKIAMFFQCEVKDLFSNPPGDSFQEFQEYKNELVTK